MRQRRFYKLGIAGLFVVALALVAGLWQTDAVHFGSGGSASAVSGEPNQVDGEGIIPNQPVADSSSADPLIFSYAIKFVCQEALQPGSAASTGIGAPIVQMKTEAVIHNPQNASVDVYKKAVEAKFESQAAPVPGGKRKVTVQPDRSFRVDCDDFAKLLKNDLTVTFLGVFGIGVKEEGFVVLHTTRALDVTADYIRGSEVLKKDISYMPWWDWWWWALPWQLGYPYERTALPVQGNFDCRQAVSNALFDDTITFSFAQPGQQSYTQNAIQIGRTLNDTHLPQGNEPAALVPLIGSCKKYVTVVNGTSTTVADVDYVIVSNRTPSDQAVGVPGGAAICPAVIAYPWIYGKFYNLNVVLPNNIDLDMDKYIRDWHQDAWVRAGAALATVQCNIGYYFPYWCGWGYWYWWWNGGDCENIGVGEGESLQAEQVTPQRVFCNQFPPTDNDGDGWYDEDPPDGINNDPANDALIDEDPSEC